MVRDELCVFMERNHSIGVHGAPPPRSSPPGLCNVNNLAGKLFPEKSAHIPLVRILPDIPAMAWFYHHFALTLCEKATQNFFQFADQGKNLGN